VLFFATAFFVAARSVLVLPFAVVFASAFLVFFRAWVRALGVLREVAFCLASLAFLAAAFFLVAAFSAFLALLAASAIFETFDVTFRSGVAFLARAPRPVFAPGPLRLPVVFLLFCPALGSAGMGCETGRRRAAEGTIVRTPRG
jgi:hypothetical protein